MVIKIEIYCNLKFAQNFELLQIDNTFNSGNNARFLYFGLTVSNLYLPIYVTRLSFEPKFKKLNRFMWRFPHVKEITLEGPSFENAFFICTCVVHRVSVTRYVLVSKNTFQLSPFGSKQCKKSHCIFNKQEITILKQLEASWKAKYYYPLVTSILYGICDL